MEDLVKKQVSYYSASRPDMLKYIDNNPKHILEVGCGAGNFSQNFSDVEFWGIEPNAEMAAKAATITHTTLNGTYDAVESKIPNSYFDLIVCNDVIEHMIDPAGFLRSVKSKLRKGGKLIASIPNLRYALLLYDLVFKGEFSYAQSGSLDYTHLHLFTQKSFEKMAASCGWHIECIEPLGAFEDFKPLKKLILKFLEHGRPGEMRTIQFAVRLSPSYT